MSKKSVRDTYDGCLFYARDGSESHLDFLGRHLLAA